MFSIFHVDLLHEIEIGVWKAVLIHLLRILEAVNENLLHEFDWRYVRFPHFFCLSLNHSLTVFDKYQHLAKIQSVGSHATPQN